MFVSANYVEDFKLVYIQNKTIMEWRTINGYGGVYQVSNTGVVKRLHHVTINKKGVLWIGDNGRLVSLGEGQKHKYMMLGRLLSDCKYFLRNPYERHLYFPSIARHCKEMRQYWLELNIKPEWLSYKQIGKLEHKMNRMKTKLDRQFKRDRRQ